MTMTEKEQRGSTHFTQEELTRYSRHMMMPEVTAEGQSRLKAARVLCIGAGGLGSPATLYLTAAGVGTIGLVDCDKVELSNLQRQILHGTREIGRSKTESARDKLQDLNPNVELELHEVRFSSDNAEALVARYDVVIDGSDNFATRYLSNDVCVWARKPNVYGSVFRFDGQSTVFAPHLGGPCYRCLFPDPPAPGTVPNCAEAGVFGVLPGIIGMIQATETIKLLTGLGEPLIGRLLLFDALKMKFREFKLRRDPQCPVCGDSPAISAPVDYDLMCGEKPPSNGAAVPTISVRDLKQKIDDGKSIALVDVRERFEYEIAHIAGSALIPLSELSDRLHELDPGTEIVALCKSGARSGYAVQLLQNAGYTRAFNLAGGIDAWANEIDPAMPRY